MILCSDANFIDDYLERNEYTIPRCHFTQRDYDKAVKVKEQQM